MENIDSIRDDIRERIKQFHNLSLNADYVNSFNLTTTFVWDYLGWTQTEWDDYVVFESIPEREFIQNGSHASEGPPMTATASLPIQRYFTRDTNPYYDITWEKRQALITKADGEVVFQQDDVIFPSSWSQNATNIVASKYFRTVNGVKERTVSDMINRVGCAIAQWGREDGYFPDDHERDIFLWELQYILVHQMASFNSPVWFNIGVPGTAQQASACYILSVEDNMPAILEWYRQEGMIFSRGSGSGVNVSKLRGKGEPISRGGVSSGPLSFMRAADASAFSIKSGGTTRRSARMVVMDMDHPDIEEFIFAKMIEERKARVLAQAGYDDSLDGEIYATVAHQNCNMSVSASDEFLERVEKGDIWTTINRTNYEGREYNAPELMHKIAQAAWDCGDPGMHFKTRMNEWHTCPNSGPIRSSNPCSEYIFLDNTACNLSSINLLKFLRDDNSFDVEGFCHTVDVMITAMEILVSRSEYPTEAITTNSEDFRTLGLGYANLGALLMAKGLPYDSDEGRDYAASITALMTGQAYKRSAELAAIKGPFNGFAANREPMLAVIDKHLRSAPTQANFEHRIWWDSIQIWDQALTLGYEHGYRNAQVTLLAPTGTISFMMDCTTTGVEPDVALVNYKKLVGGGTIKHVNDIVPRALKSLGYSEGMIREYSLWLESHGSFDDLPTEFAMNWDEKKVFDCAFPSKPGGRSIAWEGHVKMVAALQPFLSGSISKTINMPQESTVEDIERAYMMAWKLGCKSIAVYRDGCKQTQVLTTQNTEIPGTVNTQKVNKLLGDVDKLIPDGKELAAMIATSMIDEALSGKDTVGTCQTCGKSHTIVVYPYGSSPALVCTACMDSIQQQIARENTGEETNNSYWMEKIESLQSEIRALNHIIEKNGRPQRKRLPDERQAITHKFAVANCEGYLTVGLFEDGSPGEIFLRMAKEGSTLSGFADGFACMVSMALQYGIPLDVMVNKFMHSRFEPSGWTPNTDIQYATSILDYIFRYLQQKFPGNGKIIEFTGHLPPVAPEDVAGTIHVTEQPLYHEQTHSTLVMYTSHNVCPECGSFLMVNGSCHVCKTCGFQDGCTG